MEINIFFIYYKVLNANLNKYLLLLWIITINNDEILLFITFILFIPRVTIYQSTIV